MKEINLKKDYSKFFNERIHFNFKKKLILNFKENVKNIPPSRKNSKNNTIFRKIIKKVILILKKVIKFLYEKPYNNVCV